MQFRLFSFALIILNCMDYGHCQPGRWRRSKRGEWRRLLTRAAGGAAVGAPAGKGRSPAGEPRSGSAAPGQHVGRSGGEPGAVPGGSGGLLAAVLLRRSSREQQERRGRELRWEATGRSPGLPGTRMSSDRRSVPGPHSDPAGPVEPGSRWELFPTAGRAVAGRGRR